MFCIRKNLKYKRKNLKYKSKNRNYNREEKNGGYSGYIINRIFMLISYIWAKFLME